MTFEEQKLLFIKSIIEDPRMDGFSKSKSIHFINELGNNIKFTHIKLYTEHVVKGEVLWIGNSNLHTGEYEHFSGRSETGEIAPELKNDDYAYVLMKVKVKE
jgi:hypothetical protein